jgi:hypothetical protein
MADSNNWQYYTGLGDAQMNLGLYDLAIDTYKNNEAIGAVTKAADAIRLGFFLRPKCSAGTDRADEGWEWPSCASECLFSETDKHEIADERLSSAAPRTHMCQTRYIGIKR